MLQSQHSGSVTNTAVLEVGRLTTKLGIAGEDAPRAYFSSVAAVHGSDVNKSEDVEEQEVKANTKDPSSSKKKYTFDPLHNKPSHPFHLTPPITPHGSPDLDQYLATVSHAHSLCYPYASDQNLFEYTPVILILPPHTPHKQRIEVLDAMFAHTLTPAIYLAKSPVMSCFAVGRTTGMVLDVGSSSVCTPVVEGWGIEKGCMRGIGVDGMLQQVLADLDGLYGATHGAPTPLFRSSSKNNKNDDDPTGLYRTQLAHSTLEHLASHCIAEYGYNPNNYKHIPKVSYALPDGTLVGYGVERFAVGEVLFGGDNGNVNVEGKDGEEQGWGRVRAKWAQEFQQEHGSNDKEEQQDGSNNDTNDTNPMSSSSSTAPIPCHTGPLQTLVTTSTQHTPREHQSTLLSNLILSGGGACLSNIVDRMRAEVEAVIHTQFHTPGWRVKVLSPPVVERAYCGWLGGSILGSLGGINGEIYVTRQEYEEYGGNVVYRKCP